jgi:competence protein ComEC
VGRNRYGHPAPEALARLTGHGAEVWRTDREGTISVTTDGKAMTVRGRRGAVTYPVQ